ncbi:MAG: PKD domain-containing protein, partial [Bacteroidales bacterium]|nr:PKD domain-containing protein [Bacteroidales bacterium]
MNKNQKTLKRLTSNFKTGCWVIFLMIILFSSCKKDDSTLSPIIQATLTPISGKTTQTFIFDLSNSKSNTGKGSKVFTRWDWDGDGIWDTPYTRLLVYEHRYYSPGTWMPRLEMVNLDGESDTTSFTVPVLQGHSAPKPALTVTPVTGNILTPFVFDASGTKDDEDSLDQLSFRWDFESDGVWDTGFEDSSRITHRYLEPDQYTLRMQVKDPSGLTSSIESHIEVTIRDPGLVVSFRCIPDSILNNTAIIMDASASNDPDNPDKPLSYRWDWNNDLIWDTEWLTNPQTEHVFKNEFFHFVRLQVKNEYGLTNETVKKIRVYHKNEMPRASFSVSTLAGNINTVFRFDCWSTRDPESSPSEMFYRWDFDGDGNW